MQGRRKITKEKQQKTQKTPQKHIICYRNHFQEIDHQQDLTIFEEDCLSPEKTELQIFIGLNSSLRHIQQQNMLIPQIQQKLEAQDVKQDFEIQCDVSEMSCNMKFMANELLEKSEIISKDRVPRFLSYSIDHFIEQCDCKCQGSDILCQSCNCWPYCAQYRKQNLSGIITEPPNKNSYVCVNEEKLQNDYKQVTCLDIQINEEESQLLVFSAMTDELYPKTYLETPLNHPEYNIERQIDSFFNQSTLTQEDSAFSESSCGCKNKNCADARCVCKRRGRLCGPKCGCIHEECKNQGNNSPIKIIHRHQSLTQAMIDQCQLREFLEDMEFEGFQYQS